MGVNGTETEQYCDQNLSLQPFGKYITTFYICQLCQHKHRHDSVTSITGTVLTELFLNNVVLGVEV